MKLFAPHTAPLTQFLRNAARGFNDSDYRYSIPFMSPRIAIVVIRAKKLA